MEVYRGIEMASLPNPIAEEVQTEFTTSGAEESFERSWDADGSGRRPGEFESCVFNPAVSRGVEKEMAR